MADDITFLYRCFLDTPTDKKAKYHSLSPVDAGQGGPHGLECALLPKPQATLAGHPEKGVGYCLKSINRLFQS